MSAPNPAAAQHAPNPARPYNPVVNSALERFDQLQETISSYEYALNVLNYDALTVAPPAGAALGGNAVALLSARLHELEAGPATARMLGDLESFQAADPASLDQTHRDELRVMRRRYADACNVPADLLGAYKRVLAEAFPAWRAAKAASDFDAFAPYLERIFDLLRRQANCIDPKRAPYDVWLDHWEHGCSMEVCDRFFAQVGATVTPLVRELAEREASPQAAERHARLAQKAPAPEEAQQALAWDVAELMGLDRDRLTFGRTEHPFTTGMGRTDVRIAHHFSPDAVLDGLATTMHEGGHSLYEQNIDPLYEGTCLWGGASAAMHEGQSRMMENLVGRSRPFMEALLPLLRKHAPQAFADVDADGLYLMHNEARPSLIRTAADELTYPLHVLVRYECEKRLMAGDIAVREVPGLWNSLVKEHLGVDVPDDAHGCLQDMHWASDFVGYFTSYALGNAYGAQLIAHAKADYGPGYDDAIASGDLTPATSWMRERIWRHGKSLEPQDLLAQACGEPFDPSYYTRYLERKFAELL